MFDMPQLTELQWFGAYIGVGACALVLMRLYVKWVVRPPQQSEFVTEMMAAIRADQPYDWRKTAKSVLFVPLAVLVWPLSIAVGISEIRKPAKTYPEPSPQEKFRCQREHLRMPISIAEAQNLGLVTDPLGRAPALPFGHLNGAWLTFLSGQEADFSLWYFEVPLENALVRYERACRGFAWVKARKVKAEFVFETN
jgi:hypothetical protein